MTAQPATAIAPRSYIPWLFVGAMALVVAVNAVMATLAIGSFSGVILDHPYEAGLAYNRAIAAQRRQEGLGWALQVELQQETGEALAGRLVLDVTDAAGAALSGLPLSARLVRPVDRGPDVPLAFVPAGNGRYVAAVSVPRPGQWELRLVAGTGDARFDLVKRIVVR